MGKNIWKLVNVIALDDPVVFKTRRLDRSNCPRSFFRLNNQTINMCE